MLADCFDLCELAKIAFKYLENLNSWFLFQTPTPSDEARVGRPGQMFQIFQRNTLPMCQKSNMSEMSHNFCFSFQVVGQQCPVHSRKGLNLTAERFPVAEKKRTVSFVGNIGKTALSGKVRKSNKSPCSSIVWKCKMLMKCSSLSLEKCLSIGWKCQMLMKCSSISLEFVLSIGWKYQMFINWLEMRLKYLQHV